MSVSASHVDDDGVVKSNARCTNGESSLSTRSDVIAILARRAVGKGMLIVLFDSSQCGMRGLLLCGGLYTIYTESLDPSSPLFDSRAARLDPFFVMRSLRMVRPS